MRLDEHTGVREEVQDPSGTPHWGKLVSKPRIFLAGASQQSVRGRTAETSSFFWARKVPFTVVVVMAAVVLLRLMVAWSCMWLLGFSECLWLPVVACPCLSYEVAGGAP